MNLVLRIFAFIKKYWLFHIVFWTFSIVELWHLYQVHSPTSKTNNGYVAIVKLGEMAAVYTMLLYLVPNYLNKGKYLIFLGLFVASLLVYPILTMALQDVYLLMVEGRHLRRFAYLFLYTSHLVDSFLDCVIFFGVVVIPDKFSTAIRNHRLEKERLETELNFLKVQINPHFLFNAINSIYVLIEEDKKLASQVLLRFSSLLRYQLYDCSKDHMPIHSEISFLKDYVALETLRNGDDVNISFNFEPHIGHLEIPPFILIPFVENAFKHISHHSTGSNYITASLSATDHHIVFNIENSCDNYGETDKKQDGGIGLQNVRRRLQLLYPGTHQLTVQHTEHTFTVDLKLKINETAVHTGRRRAAGAERVGELYQGGPFS